jgi:hypothetical protein
LFTGHYAVTTSYHESLYNVVFVSITFTYNALLFKLIR